MTKRRAPNLTDSDILRVTELLDGWKGRLTWERLIDEIELRLHRRYCRQALSGHTRISEAFQLRKDRGESKAGSRARPRSAALQMALDRIARLEAKNLRLKVEADALLDQFARWAYNAHSKGLDEKFLNRPLPVINRGAEDPAKSPNG